MTRHPVHHHHLTSSLLRLLTAISLVLIAVAWAIPSASADELPPTDPPPVEDPVPDPPPDPDPPPPDPIPVPTSTTIVLIGDSLLQSVADEVRPQLEAAGWTVVMQYMGGTGLTPDTPAVLSGPDGANFDWQEALTYQEATHDPAVVVIILGTNDTTSVSLGVDYAPHIDRLLSATDAAVVFWADCSTTSPDPVRNEACATIGADLAAATERRDGLAVLPYDATVAETADAIQDDGVHLTQAGQDAIATLIVNAVGPAPVLPSDPSPLPK